MKQERREKWAKNLLNHKKRKCDTTEVQKKVKDFRKISDSLIQMKKSDPTKWTTEKSTTLLREAIREFLESCASENCKEDEDAIV